MKAKYQKLRLKTDAIDFILENNIKDEDELRKFISWVEKYIVIKIKEAV